MNNECMNYSVNESLNKHLVDKRWMNSTDGYKEPAAFKELCQTLAIQRFVTKVPFPQRRNCDIRYKHMQPTLVQDNVINKVL